MGNHQSRERGPAGPHHADFAGAGQSEQPSSSSTSSRPRLSDPLASSDRSSARSRSARHDLSLFSSLSRSTVEIDPASPEARKETKAEREARKLKKEREAREKERERSVREENVDGGYLVTMGVYTGTEDFSKPTVRQLMIERRIAPFWQGLENWSESWTDNQIMAAAKGLPIPPPQDNPPPRPSIGTDSSPRSSDLNLNYLNVPTASRESSYESPNLTPSHPAFSTTPQSSSYGTSQGLTSPLFRGRAKTLASLASVSRGSSQSDTTPQELRLPNDPFVNGQPLDVVLYKEPLECPICFLYYPPYLNKTRCCGHPICSECFVQIKRPDPHAPEHHADSSNAPTPEPTAENFPPEESMLVSEPATCPFCKQPELGVTYDPPPFRKGLTYATQSGHQIASVTSAMSSSSSVNSQSGGHSRRRTVSLGANSPLVVTTDRIRPDWAKKLSDARAYALRRAAAATALHTAAYLFNNNGGENGTAGPFQIGRRRRTLFGGPGDSSGPSLNIGNVGALLAAAERQGQPNARTGADGQSDLFPGRGSSRRSRADDIENMMVMEAIRLSLAAEEERKKKEEKEAAKQAKKDEKQKQKEAKEAKKAGKASRKSMLYPLGSNASSSASQLTTGGDSSILIGKGKGVDRSGEDSSPHSPVTTTPKDTSHQHLELGQTGIQVSPGPDSTHLTIPEPLPVREPHLRGHALRQLSVASSSGSSSIEAHQNEGAGSSLEPSPHSSGVNIDGASAFRSETPPGSAGLEPMFNFRSLAAVIGDEQNENKVGAMEHIEETTGLNAVTPESTSPGPEIETSSPPTANEGCPPSATGHGRNAVPDTATSQELKTSISSTAAEKKENTCEATEDHRAS